MKLRFVAAGFFAVLSSALEGPTGALQRRKAVAATKAFVLGLALSSSCLLAGPHPAAVGIENPAEVGKCVLTECQLPLLKCLGNPKCAANLVCLQTCSGRKDEIQCQIRCGDLFENEIVGEFNECAVSKKKCVPRREDDGTYAVPPDGALVKKFDVSGMEGRWFISAGLNPIFDTFDCQVHFFTSPKPGTLYGNLNWRIDEPDGEFFTRDTVQRFTQQDKPGVLFNGDNEYLHYQDTWYVLDAQTTGPVQDQFALIYYRGSNDAWDGYGGAVLYTRAPYASDVAKERAEDACEKVPGLHFADFKIPDNSCPPEIRATQKVLLREKYATKVFLTAENELQEEATTLRKSAYSTFSADAKEVLKATNKLETLIADYEKTLAKDLANAEKIIEKDVEGVEQVIANDIQSGLTKVFSSSSRGGVGK